MIPGNRKVTEHNAGSKQEKHKRQHLMQEFPLPWRNYL